MQKHKRPEGGASDGKEANRPKCIKDIRSLAPTSPDSGRATGYSFVSPTRQEERRRGALPKKPAPDRQEGGDGESFFETMTTLPAPRKNTGRGDETLVGMPLREGTDVGGGPEEFDMRKLEGKDGLPLGWHEEGGGSPKASSPPKTAQVPPAAWDEEEEHTQAFVNDRRGSRPRAGQGMARGASPLNPESPNALLTSEDLGGKTEELFPPQMQFPGKVSHCDVLESDRWESPAQSVTVEPPKPGGSKRTLFGIPLPWNLKGK